MRKVLICAFCVVIFFTSCSNNYSVYEKISKRFSNIPAYSAEGEITFYTNKTENKYSFYEYYNGMDKHLIHYTDDNLKILFDKGVVKAKYPGEVNSILLSDDYNGYMYMFVDEFFSNYYTKETSSSDEKRRYYVLEAESDTDNFQHMKLWIDSKSISPFKLEIYDLHMNLLACVKFNNFMFDVVHEENLFTL